MYHSPYIVLVLRHIYCSFIYKTKFINEIRIGESPLHLRRLRTTTLLNCIVNAEWKTKKLFRFSQLHKPFKIIGNCFGFFIYSFNATKFSLWFHVREQQVWMKIVICFSAEHSSSRYTGIKFYSEWNIWWFKNYYKYTKCVV